MPDYEICIQILNVAEADATDVAQEIWDAHAENLDAARGEFDLRVGEVKGGNVFRLDWQPEQ